MNISWYGLSCIRIESKGPLGESVLVSDPYDPKTAGLKLPRAIKADIGLFSVPAEKEARELLSPTEGASEVFCIEHAGEYEKSGIFVYGFRVHDGDRHIYTIETEDIHILYCGLLDKPLADADLEKIENIDILIVPVGGHGVLSGKEAADMAGALEPRIIIPTHYQIPGVKSHMDGADAFVKAMGGKAERPGAKLKINKKDLPQDSTQVILLDTM